MPQYLIDTEAYVIALEIIELIKADRFILCRHERSIQSTILLIDVLCVFWIHGSDNLTLYAIAEYSKDVFLVAIEVCTHKDKNSLINRKGSISNISFNIDNSESQETSVVNCRMLTIARYAIIVLFRTSTYKM